jgi:ABC-type dipeptide/oligopeptide/nickel transport system ATPase component
MSGMATPQSAPTPPADSAHDTRRGSTVSLPGTVSQGAARRRASITSLLGESSAGLLARAPPPPARACAGTSARAASAAGGATGDAWYIRTRPPREADDDAAASFPAWLEQRAAAALERVHLGDRTDHYPSQLSGGEKQRVALARLLLKSPRVVVLDEATAHLDAESEAAVQRALDETMAKRTSIVIAHRLSTIRNADQILVIDAGRIVQRGTHDELIAMGGLYNDLYQTQFAGQEGR